MAHVTSLVGNYTAKNMASDIAVLEFQEGKQTLIFYVLNDNQVFALEILYNKEKNKIFLNEEIDLELSKFYRNSGKLKIRSSGNFLLTMFNTFD